MATRAHRRSMTLKILRPMESGVSQCEQQIVQERYIVALRVRHRAAHAREAFAETQVVSGIVFRRLALGPIPLSAVLDIHDEQTVVADDLAFGLQSQVVYAAEAFFEDLRRHDRRTDGQDDAAVEF